MEHKGKFWRHHLATPGRETSLALTSIPHTNQAEPEMRSSLVRTPREETFSVAWRSPLIRIEASLIAGILGAGRFCLWGVHDASWVDRTMRGDVVDLAARSTDIH